MNYRTPTAPCQPPSYTRPMPSPSSQAEAHRSFTAIHRVAVAARRGTPPEGRSRGRTHQPGCSVRRVTLAARKDAQSKERPWRPAGMLLRRPTATAPKGALPEERPRRPSRTLHPRGDRDGPQGRSVRTATATARKGAPSEVWSRGRARPPGCSAHLGRVGPSVERPRPSVGAVTGCAAVNATLSSPFLVRT